MASDARTQGERDANVPPAMGHYQASVLPRGYAHFCPDGAHFSVAVNHAEGTLRVTLGI
jgi:hypothetical protein